MHVHMSRPVALIGGAVALTLTASAVLATTSNREQPTSHADGVLLLDQEHLAQIIDDEDVIVIDAREAEEHEQGAIPGAVSVPTETLNRTVVLDNGEEIPRIVQEAEDITERLQEAGINHDSHVVIYDNGGETAATRIFWVLDYHGHEDVSVLDGGLAGWQAHGGEISRSGPDVTRGDFVAVPQPERHADFDHVQQAMYSDAVVLCNGLSAESYEEGSIEGSSNLHATSLFDDGQVPFFRANEVLAAMLEEVGYEPGQEFLSFCGSGYMASINYFAARLLGIENVRMYDGSLVDWNARQGELLPSGRR